MGNNLHISLSSKFTGFCCSTSALAVPKVPSCSKTPLFLALTGSTFFSTFAAFVLCLSDVSDRVQSAAVLTAFLHQSASFGFFFFKKTRLFSLLFALRTRALSVYCRNYAFSSCFHTSRRWFKMVWMFSITYLLIADYFKCSHFESAVFWMTRWETISAAFIMGLLHSNSWQFPLFFFFFFAFYQNISSSCNPHIQYTEQ